MGHTPISSMLGGCMLKIAEHKELMYVLNVVFSCIGLRTINATKQFCWTISSLKKKKHCIWNIGYTYFGVIYIYIHRHIYIYIDIDMHIIYTLYIYCLLIDQYSSISKYVTHCHTIFLHDCQPRLRVPTLLQCRNGQLESKIPHKSIGMVWVTALFSWAPNRNTIWGVVKIWGKSSKPMGEYPKTILRFQLQATSSRIRF